MASDDLVKALREVVRRGAADDAGRVRGLLADLMPQAGAVVRVAVAAVQEGVPADLRRAAAGGSVSLAVNRAISRLVDEHGYERALATRVAEAWAIALGSMSEATRAASSTTPTPLREATVVDPGMPAGASDDGRPRLVVDPLAVWGAYATIGEAIAAAPAGALVVVRSGTYREALVIDKAVEVVGEGPRGAVVVESTDAHAIELRAERAAIRNLTIRAGGTGQGWGAVMVRRGRPVIEGCDLTSSVGAGMYVVGADSDPVVRACTFADGKGTGIFFLENGRGTFERCTVTGNAYAGIQVKQGGDPVVRECTFADGKGNGIYVLENGRGTFEGCTVTGNAYPGIVVQQGGDPVVRECTIARNRNHGVAVWATGRGTVTGCTLSGNVPGEWWVEGGAGGVRRNNRPDAPR